VVIRSVFSVFTAVFWHYVNTCVLTLFIGCQEWHHLRPLAGECTTLIDVIWCRLQLVALPAVLLIQLSSVIVTRWHWFVALHRCTTRPMALVNGVNGWLMSCHSRTDSKSFLLNLYVQIQPLSMATSGFVSFNFLMEHKCRQQETIIRWLVSGPSMGRLLRLV